MKGKRNVFWRAGIGILVVVSLLAIVEGTTRVHHYYKWGGLPTYKPRHLLDFYRFYRVNPEYRLPIVRVNAAGFRNDEEVTREKPENVVRIVMMGGSAVWGENANGHMIDNRDTISAHLEAILNARSSAQGLSVRVQVINAGVVGYRLFQNVIYFDHYVAGFKPDLVIAMDAHNDLDALLMGTGPYRHRNEPFFERALNHPTLLGVLWYIMKYGENKSLFIRKAYSRLASMANDGAVARMYKELGERQVTETELEEWLREYVATVRRFDASVRIAGARVLFTVQPEAVGEAHKRLTPEEVRIRQGLATYKWLHTVARDRLIARLQETTRQYGVWFEDVSGVFKDEPQQVYLDYTHLTSRGAQVMAGRLADLVEGVLFRAAPGASRIAS